MTAENNFLLAMRAAGLSPIREEIEADGQLHRYRVEGDKSGSRNGWYVLHRFPIPTGTFGSWRTGETHIWRDGAAKHATPSEQAELRRQMDAAREARNRVQRGVQADARAKALRLLALTKPATADHPYLVRKSVKAWGLRQLRDVLVIPAHDSGGQVHTLQFIDVAGEKRFLSGGRIAGCYYAIGRPQGTVLIAEGYATAATLFESTGHATAVAFNAGNLEPVARALRVKFPELRIVICADNDAGTPGNPGVTKAIEAARAIHGLVAMPDFSGGAE